MLPDRFTLISDKQAKWGETISFNGFTTDGHKVNVLKLLMTGDQHSRLYYTNMRTNLVQQNWNSATQ